MSNDRKLRWGIMGCARISRRGLIPGLLGSRRNVLLGIASRDFDRARVWSGEFRLPKAYGSYQALLDDREIDCVYIPLPNELHETWTKAAADAGKHILCEKPLARDQAEAQRMVEHCRMRKTLLMEAFMWRHQPRVREIVKMVADGCLGKLQLIRACFSFAIDAGDWRLDPSRGGGALWDIGCYGVNAARLFTSQEPTHVQAISRRGPTGVDVTLTAELAFPSGTIAVVDCSFAQPFRCSVDLVGDQARLELPNAFLPPEHPEASILDLAGKTSQTLAFPGTNQYSEMVDAFALSVSAGDTLLPPAEDGLAQMRVLDKIVKSAYVIESSVN